MVSALPWSRLIYFGSDFSPLFGVPIEKIDAVETLLVGSTAAKHDQFMIVLVVVHRAVGATGWDVPGRLYFVPGHCDCVK